MIKCCFYKMVLPIFFVQMAFLLSGCGADAQIINLLDPPAPVDRPVAIIRVDIMKDYTRDAVSVRVDGSGSYDLSDRTLTYQWILAERPLRSVATLDLPNSMITVFDADWSGCYTVTLVVTNSAKQDSKHAIRRIGISEAPKGGAWPGPDDCK